MVERNSFYLDSVLSLDPSLVSQSPEMGPMASSVASGLYLGTSLGDMRFSENPGSGTPVRK